MEIDWKLLDKTVPNFSPLKLKLIMLWTRELVVRYEPIFVLILMSEYLFHKLVLVLHHFSCFLPLFSTSILHSLHLLL